MSEYYAPVRVIDTFDRAQTLSTTPGFNGWTSKTTTTTGTPTGVVNNNRQMVLSLAANSEVEVFTMYQNDIVMLPYQRLHNIVFHAKVAGVDANTTIVLGVGSAQNNTTDNMTMNAWFKIDGSASLTAVVCETDDNVTDLDDKATGTTLGSTIRKLMIDFTNGLSDVRFFIDDRRVAASTTFNMASLNANVQPFVQVQKATGTGTPSVTISKIEFNAGDYYA